MYHKIKFSIIWGYFIFYPNCSSNVWHTVYRDLSSVSIRTLLTVLNYRTSSDALYIPIFYYEYRVLKNSVYKLWGFVKEIKWNAFLMWQISDRFSVSSPGVLEELTQDGFTEVVENVREFHYRYSWHIIGNVGKCPAISQTTIMVPAWRGPGTLCTWYQRIPEQCFS